MVGCTAIFDSKLYLLIYLYIFREKAVSILIIKSNNYIDKYIDK